MGGSRVPTTHTSRASAHPFLDISLASSHQLLSASPAPFRWPSQKLHPRSTRAQLQRQRLQEQQQQQQQQQQHESSIGASLSSHHHNGSTVLVSKAIPGLKTSAAFFDSLRTNLSLYASPPLPSPLSTPNSLRASTPFFPPSSPLADPEPISIMDPTTTSASSIDDPTTSQPPTSDDPLSGVPELQTSLATTDEERTDALKLIADSIAQQRQVANSALIFHPLNLAVAVGVIAVVARGLHLSGYDPLLIVMPCVGSLMTLLLICRYLTQDYIYAAEALTLDWLDGAEDEETQVSITKFGDEVIGVVVVDWVPSGSGGKRKRNWRGIVRAWTVRLKYRGKGVGSALLEEVVGEGKKRGAETIDFDPDHASESSSSLHLVFFEQGIPIGFERRNQGEQPRNRWVKTVANSVVPRLETNFAGLLQRCF